jgi:two-component system cell cycle response regulator
MENEEKELYGQIEKLRGELEAAKQQIELLQKRNELLERLYITDELTGLYNQRRFHDRLEREVAEHEKQQNPMCLLFFDVDGLKMYNDNYGHLGGDDILKAVAQSVTGNIRKDADSGYRYGGDEFAVILPETRTEQAVETAKRVNQGLRQAGFHNVNLSFGVAELGPGMDSKTLFRHADDAMYMAKRGRGVEFMGKISHTPGRKAPTDKIYVYD